MFEYIILFGFLSLILYTILSFIKSGLRKQPYTSRHKRFTKKQLKRLVREVKK